MFVKIQLLPENAAADKENKVLVCMWERERERDGTELWVTEREGERDRGMSKKPKCFPTLYRLLLCDNFII